ncbi:PLP-dependent aminotransferase family protein [Halomonadaceae bacterium KBTZ08]
MTRDGTLYQQLANKLVSRIEQAIYAPGDRLPGVRALSDQEGVSVSTVVSAYHWLEDQGYAEARPRSGYYIRERHEERLPEPGPSRPQSAPTPITGQEMVLQLMKASRNPGIVQLGTAVPDTSFLPLAAVERAVSRVAHQQRADAFAYEAPQGVPALRRQIARHMAGYGHMANPDDLIVTNGCQEAVSIALRAVTNPGDTVAIESPTFYGLLQVLNGLGLEALEIPTDPKAGISVEALEFALEQWSVKACVVVPNYSNPLGYCMPEARRRNLLTLLRHHNVPLIEDDVYGDLGFTHSRPGHCRSLAPEDDVFVCSSFSKTLSPGLRIGWVLPPKPRFETVEYIKYVSNLSSPTSLQLAVADLLESGRYQRHLRANRGQYEAAVTRMMNAVTRLFPSGTRVTRPEGGFVIWVELPGDIDTFELAGRALEQGVSFSPGPIFSANRKYRNCLRLSCACRWDGRVEKALATLARML